MSIRNPLVMKTGKNNTVMTMKSPAKFNIKSPVNTKFLTK
jgi:hypothetical protein